MSKKGIFSGMPNTAKKLLQRYLAFALVLVMALGVMPLSNVMADDSVVVVVNDLYELQAAIADIDNIDEIRLAANVHLTHEGGITIPSGADIIISGNGAGIAATHSSIIFEGDLPNGAINVEGGANLVLRNIGLRLPPVGFPGDAPQPAAKDGIVIRPNAAVTIEGTVETRFFTNRNAGPMAFVLHSNGILVEGGTLNINGIYNGSLRVREGVANLNSGGQIGQAGSAMNGNLATINVVNGTLNVAQNATIAQAGITNFNAHIAVEAGGTLDIKGTAHRSLHIMGGTFSLHEGALLGPPNPQNNPENWFEAGSDVYLAGRITRIVNILGDVTVEETGRIEARTYVETGGSLTIYGFVRPITAFEGSKVTLQEGGHVYGAGSGISLDTIDDPAGLHGDAVFVMNGGVVELSAASEGPTIAGMNNTRIYINNGTVRGPSVASNTLTMGNAINLSGNAFLQINNGEIFGASNRGVYNAGGSVTFEMHGGVIRDNGRANPPNLPHFNGGGGVLIGGADSTFTMTGGTISGNTAQNGGGLYAVNLNNITIGSDAVFANNVAAEGVQVNNQQAESFPLIAPGTVTYGSHAFNNHDINTTLLANRDITGYFTDPHFLAFVRGLTNVPTGSIYNADVENIINITLPAVNEVESLAGIQHFTSLQVLGVNRPAGRLHNLTYLDISQNTQLRDLRFNNNNITQLDVSNNPYLHTIQGHNNQIAGILDLTNNPALTLVDLPNNNLTELRLGNHPNLVQLNAPNNYLTGLDISGTAANWGAETAGAARLALRNNLLTSYGDVIGWPRPGLPATGVAAARTQISPQITPIISAVSLNLHTGGIGVPFNHNIQASAYNPAEITWRLADDSTLPPGLSLHAGAVEGAGVNARANAQITGAPTAGGTFVFTIEAATPLGVASETLTLEVLNIGYVYDTASLITAFANIANLDEVRFSSGAHVAHQGSLTIPSGTEILITGAGAGVGAGNSFLEFFGDLSQGAIIVESGAKVQIENFAFGINENYTQFNPVGLRIMPGATVDITGIIEARFHTTLIQPAVNSSGILVDGGTLNITAVAPATYFGSLTVNDGLVNLRGTGTGINSRLPGALAIITLHGGTTNLYAGTAIAMAGLSGANGHAYIGEDAVFNVRGTFFPGSDVFGTVNVYNGGSFGPPTGAAPATGPFHLIREGATLNQHQGAAVRRVLQIFGTWEVLPNRVVDANVIVETGGNLTISGRTRSVTVFNGGIAALEAGGHIDGMTFTQGLTLNARGTNDDAVFVMNGGIINVPAAAGSGHGPTVTMGANARFYMFNGEIQGPTAAQALLANGNAVALGEGSFFRMEGGQIHGASNRGIYNFGDNAVIEIAGGTIHSNGRGDMPINPPYFYGGGGVLIAGEGTTFNMTGGTIRNNTAPVGGGLYAVSFQNITISSAVVFEDNTATAGTAVNNALAAQFTNIAPGTVTYGNHAFNNHDINTNRIVMGEPAEITITGPAELLPKQYTQLSVNVYDANGSLISGEAVLWSITGNNDASTAITNNGLLTIGQGETIGNRHITVRATLTSNPSIYDELQVRIDRNITGDFAHAGFLTQARNRAGVPAPAPLMLSNVMDITDWFIPMPFMPAQAINNFAGIENFRSLEHLRLAGHGAGAGAGTPQNGLNGIDLSVLPNLVSFSNEHWQLSPNLGMQWIIIDNPSLESFAIEPSRLVELDTAQAPLLESLTVRRSPNLETINISQNPALENLILFSTPALSIVDTSNNVNLRSIHFTSAAGRQIDLANNINLESVQLAGEGLTGFNWPTLTGLTHLSLNNNIIADIDLSIFPNLEALDMASNQLTVLDISGNPKLETLNLNANQINHLEIGNNTALRQIVLTNNAMAQANFNFNEAPNLTALMMAHNNLTGLDVTGHPNLRYLNVINNDMAEPDDVIGWRENGMFLGNAHFVFFPQRGMTQTPPVISTQEIPTLTVGQPVHFVFENSGIIHPTWAPIWPSSNDIPAAATGLSLQPETGLLTGTPLPGSEGIWTFTIRANSHLGYYEKTFALHILPANQNTRQITFTTNSPNGQIAAFINGTQIQSGDFVPVGSDIQFIGM
ncbi:MAG: putative Ig domain-containing protein, partial [Defluviitaleaceae bacterium]|nr:putative Ig domain-containing protein [Defluviitaleaceae bacterium]